MLDPEPLPILVVRRGPLSLRALGALEHDPRVELYFADELTPDWASFAKRAAAVVVVTERDPFSALGYVVTAEVRCPIVVAMSRRFRAECRDLVEAGAAVCVTTPFTQGDVDRLLPIIALHAAPMHIDGTLRLLLDPISRVARYRDKVVRLSLREFALLHCLSSQRGRPVPAETLMTYVWGDTDVRDGTRKILDVYIFQLRKKLKNIGLNGAISTVRGFGYSLSPISTAHDN
ncbi:MAG: winged helix-turn-helix domain-containing protein [Gemmatimonadaceae bacterium]